MNRLRRSEGDEGAGTARALAYRLRGLGIVAGRAARRAAEADIDLRSFLETRLAGYEVHQPIQPWYPPPRYEIDDRCALSVIDADRPHPADLALNFTADISPPLVTDTVTAEIRALMAQLRLRIERLWERLAALEDRRQSVQLRLIEQHEAVEQAERDSSARVAAEVEARCAVDVRRPILYLFGLRLTQAAIVGSESVFLAAPLADAFQIDTSSLTTMRADAVRVVLVLGFAIVLTLAAIHAFASAGARLSEFLAARRFEERRLSRLLAPVLYLSLGAGVLGFFASLRADYAVASSGNPGSHGMVWAVCTTLLLVIAADHHRRIRHVRAVVDDATRELAARKAALRKAAACRQLAERLESKARATDTDLRSEAEQIEDGVDGLREEALALQAELRRRARTDVQRVQGFTAALAHCVTLDRAAFIWIAQRYGKSHLVPDAASPEVQIMARRPAC